MCSRLWRRALVLAPHFLRRQQGPPHLLILPPPQAYHSSLESSHVASFRNRRRLSECQRLWASLLPMWARWRLAHRLRALRPHWLKRLCRPLSTSLHSPSAVHRKPPSRLPMEARPFLHPFFNLRRRPQCPSLTGPLPRYCSVVVGPRRHHRLAVSGVKALLL
jgi:hypothetical protein